MGNAILASAREKLHATSNGRKKQNRQKRSLAQVSPIRIIGNSWEDQQLKNAAMLAQASKDNFELQEQKERRRRAPSQSILVPMTVCQGILKQKERVITPIGANDFSGYKNNSSKIFEIPVTKTVVQQL